MAFYFLKSLLTDVHAFITKVSKSVITIADRYEMLFGLLETGRTDICLSFFQFREVDICCVFVSFDTGLLWRGYPEVQTHINSDNPKRPVMQQMSAASEQLLLVYVPSQYQICLVQTVSSIRPS